MDRLSALTAGETVLAVMIPVIAAVVIAVLVILLVARGKGKANAEKPRSITSNAVPQQKKKRPAPAPRPVAAVEPESPTAAKNAEILLNPVERSESVAPSVQQSETAETADAPSESVTDKPKKIRYNRSFTARLILAPEPLKEYYAELGNKLLSFSKVKNRVGWAMSSFNAGRVKLAKLNVKGKTLYLYTALDPSAFAETKYKVTDASDKKRYAEVPCMFKVRSERAKKQALSLIETLAAEKGLAPAQKPAPPIEARSYPADTEKHLIARGLIKVKISGGTVAAPQKITPLKSVNVSQAQQLISTEVAAALVKTEHVKHAVGKKFAVNIDVLSDNFESGDSVDIAALKAKRIVPKKETAVKILARGTLDKKLTVRADDFSTDAVKMIALTGGQAIKLKH